MIPTQLIDDVVTGFLKLNIDDAAKLVAASNKGFRSSVKAAQTLNKAPNYLDDATYVARHWGDKNVAYDFANDVAPAITAKKQELFNQLSDAGYNNLGLKIGNNPTASRVYDFVEGNAPALGWTLGSAAVGVPAVMGIQSMMGGKKEKPPSTEDLLKRIQELETAQQQIIAMQMKSGVNQ